jgi:hypothetical protein
MGSDRGKFQSTEAIQKMRFLQLGSARGADRLPSHASARELFFLAPFSALRSYPVASIASVLRGNDGIDRTLYSVPGESRATAAVRLVWVFQP